MSITEKYCIKMGLSRLQSVQIGAQSGVRICKKRIAALQIDTFAALFSALWRGSGPCLVAAAGRAGRVLSLPGGGSAAVYDCGFSAFPGIRLHLADTERHDTTSLSFAASAALHHMLRRLFPSRQKTVRAAGNDQIFQREEI